MHCINRFRNLCLTVEDSNGQVLYMEYYAKSVLPNGYQPTIKEHCDAVARLASRYGMLIDLEEEAKLVGLLHDFGKYSEAFQSVLRRERSHIDHAFCGGALIGNLPLKDKQNYYPLVEAICGHHDGLVSYSDLSGYFGNSWKYTDPVETTSGKAVALAGKNDYLLAWKAFKQDHADFDWLKLCQKLPDGASSIQSMLLTRMLFSCLVDADYSTSAADEDETYISFSEITDFNPNVVLEKLNRYRDAIKAGSKADTGLNAIRDQVYEQCGNAGEQPEGLFTLTGPTGVGKTFALLHFALRHCIATGKRRIIIVLPFLTLTEQNAGEYRKVYPELLEDHSQSNLSDQEREYAARWSAPLIVTTSVRFFETLFACKPTDCRKLHNIANSVVVFDEAQSLPAELTSVTLQAVNELCIRYHTTMLFSTATQPDYDVLKSVDWKPREILPDNAELYRKLRRTTVEWRIGTDALSNRTPLEKVADEMSELPSVCVIVNLRRHARKLLEQLEKRCNSDTVFLMTTDLCSKHRSDVVEKIRERLKKGLPCRVVATQCIEAGVDFDFKVLYRALAPLDSIVQAAGRCNRNGVSPDGRVIVFLPDEPGRLYPDLWYESAAQRVMYLHHQHPIDIHNPLHLQEYYKLLFADAKDKVSLVSAITARHFQNTDKEYRLVDNSALQLIVPYDKTIFDSIYASALMTGITPGMMKQAAGITVSVYDGQTEDLERHAEPLSFSERGKPSGHLSGYYILRPQYLDCYDAVKCGLRLEATGCDDFNNSTVIF